MQGERETRGGSGWAQSGGARPGTAAGMDSHGRDGSQTPERDGISDRSTWQTKQPRGGGAEGSTQDRTAGLMIGGAVPTVATPAPTPVAGLAPVATRMQCDQKHGPRAMGPGEQGMGDEYDLSVYSVIMT